MEENPRPKKIHNQRKSTNKPKHEEVESYSFFPILLPYPSQFKLKLLYWSGGGWWVG
jgi:hypothetical protein